MKKVYEGGNLLIQALASLGVKEVFSLSGGPINSIYQAASAHGLPLIQTRHEAGAGYMADAVAKSTGRAGVVAVTLGPATSNVVTNALMAKMSGTPMFIIGGQGMMEHLDCDAEMMADSVGIMTPVTKFAARVMSTERIPEYVNKAWGLMWAGRPGPVFLEIPMDVLSAPATPVEFTPSPIRRGTDIPADVAVEITKAFQAAKRPLVLIGDEAFWEQKHGFEPAELEAAVDQHQLLFSQLRMGRGIIDERHDLCCGLGCAYANATLRKAMRETDLVVVLGHYLESDLNFGADIEPGCKVVQVYIDAAHHGIGRQADISTAGSVKSATEMLLNMPTLQTDADWTNSLASQWREERTAEINVEEEAGPLHPAVVLDAVTQVAPKETIFACGAGNVDFWIDERFQVTSPGTLLKGGLGGGMGADIPYGIGAKAANSSSPVIVFLGDGSVGYHAMELETAARTNQPVIVIVLDDQKWGAIAMPQKEKYGCEFEMDLPERDWPAVSRALGGVGFRAETVEEVQDAVAKALEAGKPALIHVPVRSVISPFMDFVGY